MLQANADVVLLLTDLLAPGTLDAAELLDRARQIRPDLQGVITTDLERFSRPPDRSATDSPMIRTLSTLLKRA